MTEKTEKNPVILYAEDDEVLAFVTKDNLELNGFEVLHCANGREALQIYTKMKFDLCILDIMMPLMDGFELAKAIREVDKEVPILFLSARSLKEDRIKGLKIGADDYLSKPFVFEELLLKIKVFLKRKYLVQEEVERVYEIGEYRFDYQDLALLHGQELRRLTQKEADVLMFLYMKKNVIVNRSDILKKVWKQDDYFVGRSLDVFISRLRKYLKKDEKLAIENIHGVGFKFICQD